VETAEILSLLFHYFKLYGYYLVFFALLLENVAFIGLIVPGETVLLAASFFAFWGEFNIVSVVLTAIAGAFIGNNIGYFLGRRGGRPFIERFGDRFFISKERIRAAEAYFDEHGGKTVFIGRFATGIRVFIPLLAGAAHMNYARFFLYTLAAVLIWTVGIGTLGYLFGQYWSWIVKVLGRIGWVGLAAVIILLLFFLISRRR